MMVRAKGHCVTCGWVTGTKFTYVAKVADAALRPAYCTAPADDPICRHLVGSPHNPLPLHLYGRQKRFAPPNEPGEDFHLDLQPPNRSKDGWNMCEECVRQNRSVHEELQAVHVQQQQQPAPSQPPLLPLPAQQQPLAAPQLQAGTPALAAALESGVPLTCGAFAPAGAVAGVSGSGGGITQTRTVLGDITAVHAEIGNAVRPSTRRAIAAAAAAVAAEAAADAPPAAMSAAGVLLPGGPARRHDGAALPPPSPPPSQQPAPPPPPAVPAGARRPPKPQRNFWTDFNGSTPTEAELVCYVLLDVYYNNSKGRTYDAAATRAPNLQQGAFFALFAAAYQELTGHHCTARHVQTYVELSRRHDAVTLLSGSKRVNAFHTAVETLANSRAGKCLEAVLWQPSPAMARGAAELHAKLIMAAAKDAVNSVGELLSAVPHAKRLALIHASFKPGNQAGSSPWASGVLAAWTCKLEVSGDLSRLRFSRVSGHHHHNHLRLYLLSDLSFYVENAGRDVMLPPDAPGNKRPRA